MSFIKVDVWRKEDISLSEVDISIIRSVSSGFREKIEDILEEVKMAPDKKESFIQNTIYLNTLFYFWYQACLWVRIKEGASEFSNSSIFVYSTYRWVNTYNELGSIKLRINETRSNPNINWLLFPTEKNDRFELVDVSDLRQLKNVFFIIYKAYKILRERDFNSLQLNLWQVPPDSPITNIRI